MTLNIIQYYTYEAFYQLNTELAAKFQTTGKDQTEEHKKYTQLNQKRMERWNKTFELKSEWAAIFKKMTEKQEWIVITESWCGDSAQQLPAIAKIAAASEGKINLKIILRDENPDWIERYKTNGTYSIPKLIAFNTDQKELFSWGPRPQGAVEIQKHWKANTDTIDKEQFHVLLHTWYGKNKGEELQQELMKLLMQTI